MISRKKDNSYGIVPIRNTERGWEVLLINQYSRIGDNTYWALPKGHPETGEEPRQAAIRELKEETGLVVREFFESPVFTLQYQFTFEGVHVDKTATFFIGVVNDTAVQIDDREVKEAQWLSFARAEMQLDHEDAKRMFRQIRRYVEESLL